MVVLFVCIVLLIVPPLLGVVLRGNPMAPYLEVPPVTRYVPQAPFSWPVFVALLVAIVAFCVWFYTPWRKATGSSGALSICRKRFPWWGWFGTALVALSWAAAWGRPPFLGSLRDFTFTPLWFGFILVLDGLVHWRRGHSMLTRSPVGFWLLFPISAAAWWYFEFLNRFVQNWYYSEYLRNYSALKYVLSATPPFSMVLPAVFESAEFIGSTRWVRSHYGGRPALPRLPRWGPALLLGAGVLGGAATAWFPTYCFPLLWLAPLLIVGSLLALAGKRSPLDWLQLGNHRPAVCFSLGALLCGFFWEMWNYWSVPKWHYAIPFVDRFSVFEMPILGYAGYLPFGIECYCAFLLLRQAFPTEFFERLHPGGTDVEDAPSA